MDDVQLEPIGNFLNRIDADLACSALLAAGIPAVVSADDAGGARPHLWMGGVKVLVRAEDVEDAARILREAEETKPAPDPESREQ